MKGLIFYTGLFLLIEYGLGYGLTQRILPKSLTRYSLFLSPWILNAVVIFLMVVTSLLGIAGKYTAWGSAMIFAILTLSKLKQPKVGMFEFILLGTVGVSVLLNNSPLVLRDKFLTTISLGNNDVIAYATNADYLVSNSIRDSFSQDVSLTVANLLQDGYRWGTPLLQTFFLSLSGTESWKVTYLIQTILFATMIPLGYVLYTQWYGKGGGRVVVPLLIAFNANLLYMLYHNFYGQVVFWGIELLIVVLTTEYWKNPSLKLEWLTGGSIAAMYMTYHEPALFVLIPLVIGSIFYKNWQGMIRIAGVTILLASVSVVNAIVFDFGQAFRGNPNQPIGWHIFRSDSPVSNPIEILGLSSVHTAEPLAPWLAWVGSLGVILLVIVGILSSKSRRYLIGMMSFFGIMFYWSIMGKSGNWFVFNRAFTYVLPILVVMFVGGLSQLQNKVARWSLILVSAVLVLTQGIRLNYRFINSHLSVHAWYQTLRSVSEREINEPIYTTGMINPYVSIWDQIWMGYFLYSNTDDETLPKTPYSKDSLLLANKSTPWVRYPSYLVEDVTWENSFYALGRLCLSDECLLRNQGHLSQIVFGESTYEDSLLVSGWSNPEKEARWIEGDEAELKLVVASGAHYNKLKIEMQALVSDARVVMMLDDIELGEVSVGTDWQSNTVAVSIIPGIHRIKIVSNGAKSPNELDISDDTRKLSIRLKRIGFENF